MTTAPRQTARRSIFTALAAALVAGAAAPAQTTSPPPAGAVELVDRPYVIESLGLSIRLPVGATLDSTRFGGADAAFTMYSEDNTWRLQLHTPQSRDKSLTVARVAEGLLEELKASRRVRDPRTGEPVRNPNTGETLDTAVQVIQQVRDLTVGSADAARFYVRLPRPDGVNIVSGYTVFRVGPGRFAVLEMDTVEPQFDRARAAYETVVAAVEVRDPQQVAAERAAGVLAGDKLLQSINAEDLRELLPENERWFRTYRPAPTGAVGDAQEVAYQRVLIKEGQRGDLDPRKPKSRWTAADRQWGFVVKVEGRFLDSAERIVDSQSIFYLASDRTEEAWSVRMTVREGSATANWVETGVRNGKQIKVTVDAPRQPAVEKQWRTPEEAYLSQVEKYLLPRIFAHVGAETEFAFYTYQSGETDILLRSDSVERGPSGEGWVITARQTEDAAPERTVVDNLGRIVRRELSSGLIMEPVKLNRLVSIWRDKGLPTE